MKPNCIAISYAKRLFDASSTDRRRIMNYAVSFHQYHVIVFTHRDEGFPDTVTDGSLTIHATNASSKIMMLVRALSIGRRIISENSAETYTVTSQDPFETSLIGRLLTRGTPHQHHVQIHGDVFNPHSYQGSLRQRIRVAYARQVVQTSARIRVVSQRIKRSLLTMGVAEQRITVLPVQPDLEPFLRIGAARQVDKSLPLRLLYVGRLAPEKDLSLLLRACATLQQRGVDFTLAMVGDGPCAASLQRLAAEEGIVSRVSFIPWSHDIASYMQQAHVLCLTSQHEGWAMVLQEAAAAGLAIVTTDVGCASDLLRHNQEALLAPVGDSDCFADHLMQLQNPTKRQQLGQAAYERVVATARTPEDYQAQLVASLQLVTENH